MISILSWRQVLKGPGKPFRTRFGCDHCFFRRPSWLRWARWAPLGSSSACPFRGIRPRPRPLRPWCRCRWGSSSTTIRGRCWREAKPSGRPPNRPSAGFLIDWWRTKYRWSSVERTRWRPWRSRCCFLVRWSTGSAWRPNHLRRTLTTCWLRWRRWLPAEWLRNSSSSLMPLWGSFYLSSRRGLNCETQVFLAKTPLEPTYYTTKD